jgi:hypothetical protein
VSVFIALLAAFFVRYDTGSLDEVRPPADCAQYFHRICDNWPVAAWLPSLSTDNKAPAYEVAREVGFIDGFIYEGIVPHGPGFAQTHGFPQDGTPFVYGMAGPPRGTLVYDPARATVFYSQGCCSWSTAVAATNVAPPPISVVSRDLRALRTVHGISLGMREGDVQAIYGRTAEQVVLRHPQLRMLRYKHDISESCMQMQEFGFVDGRLIYIALSDAC